MVGVFGLRGELKVAASRIGEDALRAGLDLRARLPDGTERALRIRALRRNLGRPLITVEGVDDANAAASLVGATLHLDRSAVQLEPGEYFDDDLAGCALVDASGATLARVRTVEHYPAQDVLLLESGAMVPLVRAFIKNVDVRAKQILVDVPAGLLDASAAEEA
ncbi:MAG TPA: ribosome maturation factor RimM [Candidatus Elarobacter sp.]|nr:ribosome maturation factor RimM [Candidatus Elarobacter sp.]